MRPPTKYHETNYWCLPTSIIRSLDVKILAGKEGMKEYLRSLPPEHMFKTRDKCDCPVACYMVAGVTGLSRISFEPAEEVETKPKSVQWMHWLGKAVDALPGPGVCAGVVLEMLEAVP